MTYAFRSTVAGLFSLGAVTASAQEVRTVYASMPFNVERGILTTSACLQLVERVYPATAWWETTTAATPAPDRAFKLVIAAMKQQNREALFQLTYPAQLRNTSLFDIQARAYFQQFNLLQLLAVPRAYELDGLVMFFGKFRSVNQTPLVPLTFAYQGRNTFGFLPSRSDRTTFRLVNDWFARSGSASADTPTYCADSDVKRATHRVSLIGAAEWQPSSLLLTGAPLNTSGPLSSTVAQIKSTIDGMKEVFRGPDVNDFFKYQTPEDGARLRQWFASVTQAERDRYKKDFVEQQPFFVFDESPLLVVYTRMGNDAIRVLYFKVGEDNRLLWMNSSYHTLAHPVFERGPLFAAAASAKPFSSLLIK